jgi:Ca2+-binding RTX toxin-like protein
MPLRLLRTAAASALVLAATVVIAPAASAISDVCLYDSTAKTVDVLFPTGANQYRTLAREAGGDHIQYNGANCGNAKVTNTNLITVTTFDGAQNLTIDLGDGSFAPGATAEGTGASEIEFQVDLGNGTDTINILGSSGNDHLGLHGATKGNLNGDADTDITLANVEQRYLYGGNGNDVLSGSGPGPWVQIYGQGGDDDLTGSAASESLYGASGDDTLAAGAGDDSLEGGQGNDVMDGGDDDDYFYGGTGNDRMQGGRSDDYFYAESGADGADRFLGGPGSSDEASYGNRSTDVVLNLDGQANDGGTGEHDLIGRDVESLDGGSGNDSLTGSAANNYLYGYGGNDTLKGLDGDDGLYGYAGNDTLRGGNDDDSLGAGDGNDAVYGDAGDDSLYAEGTVDGDDDLHGGTGGDQLAYYYRSVGVTLAIGTTGNGGIAENDTIGDDIESLQGTSGDDTLIGGPGPNTLYGNGGIDTIDGLAGADNISGGVGNDTLTGGDGYDNVSGDDGDDVLHLSDGGTDGANCGAGAGDNAADRDIYDTTLTGCETT